MRIHRSLPARPGIDEVEAARGLIGNVEKEDQARLEAIARQSKGVDVPEELFMVLQEMQRNVLYYQSKEQKREAVKLLDLDNVHSLFDELIQRASKCVASPSAKTSYSNGSASSVSTSLSKNSNTPSFVYTLHTFTSHHISHPHYCYYHFSERSETGKRKSAQVFFFFFFFGCSVRGCFEGARMDCDR